MELAIGTIDGSNRTFTTTYSYIAGTVRAFTPMLNHEVSVTELGSNIVEIEVAPDLGDLVYLAYHSV